MSISINNQYYLWLNLWSIRTFDGDCVQLWFFWRFRTLLCVWRCASVGLCSASVPSVGDAFFPLDLAQNRDAGSRNLPQLHGRASHCDADSVVDRAVPLLVATPFVVDSWEGNVVVLSAQSPVPIFSFPSGVCCFPSASCSTSSLCSSAKRIRAMPGLSVRVFRHVCVASDGGVASCTALLAACHLFFPTLLVPHNARLVKLVILYHDVPPCVLALFHHLRRNSASNTSATRKTGSCSKSCL